MDGRGGLGCRPAECLRDGAGTSGTSSICTSLGSMTWWSVTTYATSASVFTTKPEPLPEPPSVFTFTNTVAALTASTTPFGIPSSARTTSADRSRITSATKTWHRSLSHVDLIRHVKRKTDFSEAEHVNQVCRIGESQTPQNLTSCGRPEARLLINKTQYLK